MPDHGPYHHTTISKTEADELLLADNGAEEDGKFLFRARVGTKEHILSVIYKGSGTHHKVTPDDTGLLQINGQPTGTATFVELTDHLREKRPKWPVPLTTGVPSGSGGESSSAVAGGDGGESTSAVSAVAGGDDETYNHGPITKDVASGLLLADGGATVSGKFLFRQPHDSGNTFILSVVYKGAPTHHKVSRSSAGEEFEVNNTPTGCTSLSQVKEHLTEKRPKWPVPLTEFVPKGSQAPPPATDAPTQATAATAAPEPEIAAPAPRTVSDTDDSDIVHTSCSKDQADALLLADGGAAVPGKYLIRASRGDDALTFVLSVVFKSTATHHKLVRKSEGAEYAINGQPTGQTTLANVTAYLGTKQPKWPVALVQRVSPGDQSTAPPSPVKATTPPPKAKPVVKKAPPAEAPAAAATAHGAGEFGAHFHGDLSKAEADQLLLANNGTDGKWLVRSKGGSTDTLFFGVIYRGKPTHHALIRSGPGAEFLLNKEPTGCTDVGAVEAYLKVKRAKWPVPLTEGVVGNVVENEVKAVAPEQLAQTAVATAAPDVGDGGTFEYEHPAISKEEADRLLLAGNGGSTSGKFLFRAKKGTVGEYVLSVIYKSKPTHHNVGVDNDGNFTVNKQPTGFGTLAEVATHLGSKRPKWPVPLTVGVPGPLAMLVATKAAATATPAASTSNGPKSNGAGHARTGSGDNGFSNWTAPTNSEPLRVPAPLSTGGPTDGAGSVQKRDISATWRRKKLSALESKPTVLGQWATDGHGSRDHAYGNYDSEVAAAKHTETLKRIQSQEGVAMTHGMMLTKTAARRVSEISPEPEDLAASTNAPTVECTFLGNCRCPNCV